jgi:ligand-binding sensor domain-containing protein
LYFYSLAQKSFVKGRRFYHLLSALFLICRLAGQTPAFNFKKLGSEEGLQNANIFNIDQHPNGLMYITTQNGIYQYDGYSFTKLGIDSLKTNALLSASVKNPEELYISVNNEGLADYHLATGRYAFNDKFRFTEKQDKFSSADQFILSEDYAYLLQSQVKLLIIDLKTGEKIADDKYGSKEKRNQALCLFKTKEGAVLVGRNDGLYRLKGKVQEKLELLKNTPVHSIAQNADGSLLFGTQNKIVTVKDNKVVQEFSPRIKSNTFLAGGVTSIDKIVADDHGRVWFTPYPDQTLYLLQNKTVYDIFEILDIAPSLINCVYKDRDQNIWIGTTSEGIYFIQNSYFNSINFLFNGKSLNIQHVYLKDNLLVAGTNNGLYGLNITSNQSKVLSKPDAVITEPIGNIREINNVIYYSKRNEFNLSPSILSDSKHAYRFKPLIASHFYPVDDRRVVVADKWANVLLTDLSGGKAPDTLISFPDYRIAVNTFIKKNDSLVVVTNNGLFIYDFKNKTYSKVMRPDLSYKLNDAAFIRNKLYVAHEAGITDVSGRQLMQQLGSLRLNSVKKIKIHQERIWLATLDGIYVCDMNFKPLKVINKGSGLLSNAISDIAFSDETVCIATARGISVSKLQNILAEDRKLKAVTIHQMSSNGDTLAFNKGRVFLNSDQENLNIHFYSPVFSKPNKQLYRYRYDGGEWIRLVENSLSKDIASGGNHRLEISVSVDNIVWSDVTRVDISKEEKLTETAWIYWIITLCGLLFISGVSFLIIKRVNAQAKRRLQEEQQVNLLKHQAMNALLSPHFIFNSLTSIQNYINSNNGLKASEYLAKFSRLIRMIIEKAAQSEITLQDELTRLSYYLELEKERFKNKFDFSIDVDEKLNASEIKIPNMIIQPHVENCIIHGILPKLEHGALQISFKKTEDRKLQIIIEDNGIGLIKAREHAKTGHKSLGTSTIKNILEINSKLSGKKQTVSMVDKSTLSPASNGTLITIEIEL